MNLIEERNCLFDSNFHPLINDTERVVRFCRILSDMSGIQCCTHRGEMFETLPKVYNSLCQNVESVSE